MRILFMIISCLCLNSIQAQTQKEGLIKLDSINRLLDEKVSAVNSKAQFELKFKMHLTYNSNGVTDSLVYSGHVISDRTKKYFFEKDKRIYQDNLVTISVIKKTKEIHFFDTPPVEYQKLKTEKFKFLEDKLLQEAANIVCYKNEYIKLNFEKENKVTQGIKEIKIKLDPLKTISSIETIYYPGYQYARMYTEYEKIDFDSKTKILSKTLEANILNNGQLVSEYKNYTVYDHRKKN